MSFFKAGDTGKVRLDKHNAHKSLTDEAVASGLYLGSFATSTALNSAYASPTAGQEAYVVATDTIWYVSSGTWTDSTNTPSWYAPTETLESYVNGRILDEDNFATDSATDAPSQQSTKVYTDGKVLDEDDLVTDSITKAPSQQSVIVYSDKRSFIQLLPNADFSVEQYDAGTSALGNTDYFLDTWRYGKTGTMGVSCTSETTSPPTVFQAGKYLTNYLVSTVITAQGTLAAGDNSIITGFIEGYDWQHLARTDFYIGFWHRHTNIGTYCVSVRNSADDRSYIVEYTQTVGSAWEWAKVKISASPSSGTWNFTKGVGASISWVQACGTTYHGTADTWLSSLKLATSAQENAVDSIGVLFKIAGIVIGNANVTSSHPNFEAKLNHVKRYFEVLPSWATSGGAYAVMGNGAMISSTVAEILLNYHEKRDDPTLDYIALSNWQLHAGSANRDATAISFTNTGTKGTVISVTHVGTALTDGDAVQLRRKNDTSKIITVAARF